MAEVYETDAIGAMVVRGRAERAMPKSRKRKRKPHVGRVTPPAIEALLEQAKAFRAKFGRDPGPNDPVFFDPDSDVPRPMPSVDDEVLGAMRNANLPPELMYAYRKTGLLLLADNHDRLPKDRVEEWNAAIREYHAMQDAMNRPDRPDPEAWSTEVPELVTSGFSKADLAQVTQCLEAISPIEARGMKLCAQIELAAVLMAATCAHGYRAGEATGKPGDGSVVYSATESIILRRAREIYAKDHM
jgi:hypothetical protein